jgi:hypothetical protein
MVRGLVLVGVLVTCSASMAEPRTANLPQFQPGTTALHPKSRC